MIESKCCFNGFTWDGELQGEVVPFPTSTNQAYKTGSNPDVAILYVHDGVGWKFKNARLLADHYAKEANATVYLPDFLNGEEIDLKVLDLEPHKWAAHGIDIHGMIKRNSREIREPEIFACAKKLRAEYKKVGAIGFCYGGWAVFRLGARENDFVDCIVAGHPSMLTKEDIDGVNVPVQLLAPEHDMAFMPELKNHFWEVMMKRGDLAFDYLHLPGVVHGALVRGDEKKPGERRAMTRAKNAAVGFFMEHLHGV